MNGSRVIAKMAGNAVDGEDQVAPLHHEEHQHQRRGEQPARAGAAGEVVAVVAVGERQHPPRQPHEGVLLRLDPLHPLQQHPDAGQDQDPAEDVDDPVEPGSSSAPGVIMMTRMTMAPRMPHLSTFGWASAGTPK